MISFITPSVGPFPPVSLVYTSASPTWRWALSFVSSAHLPGLGLSCHSPAPAIQLSVSIFPSSTNTTQEYKLWTLQELASCTRCNVFLSSSAEISLPHLNGLLHQGGVGDAPPPFPVYLSLISLVKHRSCFIWWKHLRVKCEECREMVTRHPPCPEGSVVQEPRVLRPAGGSGAFADSVTILVS